MVTRFLPAALIGTVAVSALIILLSDSSQTERMSMWKRYHYGGMRSALDENWIAAEKMYRAALDEAKHYSALSNLEALTMYQLAKTYAAQGKIEPAERLLVQAAAIQSAIASKPNAPQDDRTDLLLTEIELASVYCSQKKYEKAEPLLLDAIEQAEGKPSSKQTKSNSVEQRYLSGQNAFALILLSRIRAAQNNNKEANSLLRQAYAMLGKAPELERYKQMLSKDYQPDQAAEQSSILVDSSIKADRLRAERDKLSDAGWTAYTQGKFEEAERLFKSEEKVLAALGGDKTDMEVTCWSRLAIVMMDRADYQHAQPYARRVLEIARKSSGDSDAIDSATINLAVTYDRKNLYAQGLEFAEQLLRMRESKDSDKRTAEALGTLALLQRHNGKHAIACGLRERAVALWKGCEGEDSKEYAAGLKHLADELAMAGNVDRANHIYIQWFSNAARDPGKQVIASPASKDAQVMAKEFLSLAGILAPRNDIDEIEPLFVQALALIKQSSGSKEQQADILTKLGSFHNQQNQGREKAAPVLREAMALVKDLPADSLLKLQTQMAFALNLRQMGWAKKDDSLMLQAIAINSKVIEILRKKSDPESAEMLTITLGRQGRWLKKLHRTEEARIYEKELLTRKHK